jgi:hypothetical protein
MLYTLPLCKCGKPIAQRRNCIPTKCRDCQIKERKEKDRIRKHIEYENSKKKRL